MEAKKKLKKERRKSREEITAIYYCILLLPAWIFLATDTYTDFPEEIEKEKSGKNCALIFAEDNVEKEEGIGSLLFLKK